MAISYGKWTKHKLMKKTDRILPYLPETALLTEKTLWSFIEKYQQIFVKPSFGYGGRGIIQITALENEQFEIHSWHKKNIVNNKQEIIDYMKKKLSKKNRHIVQEKIPLAIIDGSPFDIRVMIQRKKGSSDWKVTGKMAKIAARGFVITNAAKGVAQVEDALTMATLEKISISDLIKEIDEISLMTANHLQNYYKKSRRIGLDIGIDQLGRPWIIEANLTPSIAMFNKLEDKSIIEEIKEYRNG